MVYKHRPYTLSSMGICSLVWAKVTLRQTERLRDMPRPGLRCQGVRYTRPRLCRHVSQSLEIAGGTRARANTVCIVQDYRLVDLRFREDRNKHHHHHHLDRCQGLNKPAVAKFRQSKASSSKGTGSHRHLAYTNNTTRTHARSLPAHTHRRMIIGQR